MIRFYYIIICLLISVNTFTQEVEWAPLTREVSISTPDSTIKARIMINPTDFNVVDEYMYYWHNRGQINKNMGGYSGDILHDSYFVLNKDKAMITQGQFKEGLKHGTWKRWYSNGNLRTVENWKNSQLNGVVKHYYEDGDLRAILKYKNGVIELKEDKNFSIFRMGDRVANDSIQSDTLLVPHNK